MVDNHQDANNFIQQLLRWLITILYSNMQSCWQPINMLLSAHILQHIPSGSISVVSYHNTAVMKKETHAKQSVPW